MDATETQLDKGESLNEKRNIKEKCGNVSYNERGPWWNSGSSHMNEAYPKRYFDFIGLLKLQQIHFKYI